MIIFRFRNEGLYIDPTTTTTTTAKPQVKIVYVERPLRPQPARNRGRPRPGGGRRRPNNRPKRPPIQEYDYYYDSPSQPSQANKQATYEDYPNYDYDYSIQDRATPAPVVTRAPVRISRPSAVRNPTRINQRVHAAPDYDYTFNQGPKQPPLPPKKKKKRRRKKKRTTTTTTTTTTTAPEDEYYYEYYYYDDETTTTSTTLPPLRFRRPIQPRPTARDRQAHLQTRKQQLINGKRRPSHDQSQVQIPQVERQESAVYYDDNPLPLTEDTFSPAFEPSRSQSSFVPIPDFQSSQFSNRGRPTSRRQQRFRGQIEK